MTSSFKNTKVKLDLLTDIDKLLKLKKSIRSGTCRAFHRFLKANNKYMKDYDKNIHGQWHKSLKIHLDLVKVL